MTSLPVVREVDLLFISYISIASHRVLCSFIIKVKKQDEKKFIWELIISLESLLIKDFLKVSIGNIGALEIHHEKF